MQVDQGKNEAFQVLHEVEEGGEAVGVLGLLHLCVGADLRGLQSDLACAHAHHQLLLADLVGLGPLLILAVQDAALEHDLAHLVDDRLRDEGLLADELVALVLRVVVVLQLARRVHLEIQELVAVGSAVPDAAWRHAY